MNKKCIVILSFIEHLTKEYIRKAAADADYIICADGGEAIARECGVIPDCVIGDFDSDSCKKHSDCTYITYPAEKDFSDTEACLLHAAEAGYREITLIGGINGRLDHTLANIALLIKYRNSVQSLTFEDMCNSVTLLCNSSLRLYPDSRFKYFGLISITPVSRGVTISGAKYPLSDAKLRYDTSLGISNEITGKHADISVRNGTLLVTRSF